MTPDGVRRRSPLSPREQEIVDLIARGRSVLAAAAELDIGYGTVRTHLARISRKTKVPATRTAILIWALRHGFPLKPPASANPENN